MSEKSRLLEETNRSVTNIKEQDKQIAEEQQGKFRAKAKKAISRLLPKWLSEWSKKRNYSQWLQIKHAELTVQALELQIIGLNLELKESREAKRLDKHVDRWSHREEYVE